MAIRLSSALRTSVMTAYGLGQLLQAGHIRLYSGAQPADGDAAEVGTYLGRITTDGLAAPTPANSAGGLMLQGGAAGTLVRLGTWVITGVAAGTVGWGRFVSLGHDHAAASLTAMRLDFGAADVFATGTIPTTTNGGQLPFADFLLTLPSTT